MIADGYRITAIQPAVQGLPYQPFAGRFRSSVRQVLPRFDQRTGFVQRCVQWLAHQGIDRAEMDEAAHAGLKARLYQVVCAEDVDRCQPLPLIHRDGNMRRRVVHELGALKRAAQ